MTLNNWLCKYFDKEKKGYVNIDDILSLLSLFFIVIISASLVFSLFLKGIIFILSNAWNFNESNNLFNTNIDGVDMFGFMGVIIWCLIVIILCCGIISYICNIKIAKCDVK